MRHDWVVLFLRTSAGCHTETGTYVKTKPYVKTYLKTKLNMVLAGEVGDVSLSSSEMAFGFFLSCIFSHYGYLFDALF